MSVSPKLCFESQGIPEDEGRGLRYHAGETDVFRIAKPPHSHSLTSVISILHGPPATALLCFWDIFIFLGVCDRSSRAVPYRGVSWSCLWRRGATTVTPAGLGPGRNRRRRPGSLLTQLTITTLVATEVGP